MLVEVWILLIALVLAIWKYVKVKTNFFNGRNCKHDIFFPILGSMRSLIFKNKSVMDVIIEIYEKAKGNKIYGVFENNKPSFYINDPELIRQITIKGFEHFVNHRNFLEGSGDNSIFGSSLFLMQNQKWKDMRYTLTPAFTGSRMRMMFQLIKDVATQARDYLRLQENIESGRDLDMKEFFTHYTSDIIASVAFGIEVNSLADASHEFYIFGKSLLKFGIIRSLKFFIAFNCTSLAKFLKIQLWSSNEINYFKSLVLDAMKYRTEKNILRHDMINILMEAKGMGVDENVKESLKSSHEWTDIEIVAQCFVFFIAGFESTATLITFVAHELMENPEIQEKLFNEITEVQKILDRKTLTYESLNNMKYLDMVISETLRKWPTTPGTDRVCSKSIHFKNPDGLGDVTINAGESIFIPFIGLHRDPKYFPDPDKFDPERFSDENKQNIQGFTYLPFGVGPRACIGNRLGLLETKAILYYLIGEFSIEPSVKSTIPLDLSGSLFQPKPKNGFWLKLRKRAEC
ncbi:hypothetical protein ACFFRR_001052 [Megaselia abdita]